MRILFCNNFYPGHFEALAGYLASLPGHDVFFAFSNKRRGFSLPGLRLIHFKSSIDRISEESEPLVRQWRKVVRKGNEGRRAFLNLKESASSPDMILFNAECGESLFLEEVFPSAFRVAYGALESIAMRNDKQTAIALLGHGFLQANAAYIFSSAERIVPDWLRPAIEVLPISIDTDFFRPSGHMPIEKDSDPRQNNEQLISIAVHTSEPSKWLNSFEPFIAALLQQRPSCHILLLCTLAQVRHVLKSALLHSCPDRLHVIEATTSSQYRDAFAASSVQIFPAAETPTRHLLEAMSCESIVLAQAPDINCRAIRPGKTMLLWPKQPNEQLRLVNHVLDDYRDMYSMRCTARKAVVDLCDQQKVIPIHVEDILNAYKKWKD